MNQQERAKELAAAHWGYVKPTMEVHAMLNREDTDLNEPVYSWNEMMEIAAYHYRTAMQHGHGHGVEDQRNRLFDTEGAAAAIADVKRDMGEKDNLCSSCQRNAPLMCHGEYLVTKDGGCEGYISALRENMLDAKGAAPLCISCAVQECEAADAWRNICSLYVAKQEPPTAADLPLDFTLPLISLKCTKEEAWAKFESECAEWLAAKPGSLHELVECWDRLQAINTFFQRGGNIALYQEHSRLVKMDLTEYAANGRDVMEARRGLLLKNARRQYYSHDVNAAIIASNGLTFPTQGGKP